jgi:hypothetical protein
LRDGLHAAPSFLELRVACETTGFAVNVKRLFHRRSQGGFCRCAKRMRN